MCHFSYHHVSYTHIGVIDPPHPETKLWPLTTAPPITESGVVLRGSVCDCVTLKALVKQGVEHSRIAVVKLNLWKVINRGWLNKWGLKNCEVDFVRVGTGFAYQLANRRLGI